MIIYVDIDDTICHYPNKRSGDYTEAVPTYEHIGKINRLFDEGHTIIYWTARGSVTKIDWKDITRQQLLDWGCKFHQLITGEKPNYDLLICDKTKRIEEI